MHSSVAANAGWLSSLSIKKHLGAISALVFSLILSACGGGGSDGPSLTAVDGAPTLGTVSIASGDKTTVTVGDIVTVSVTASEAIQAPSVTIAGTAATAVTGSGESWSAERAMTAADTAGDITFSVSFSDIAGNVGTAVNATTDGTALTFEVSAEAGNVVDGPFQNAKAFADYNGNGIHDDGEPSALTDEAGAYSLTKDNTAPESYTVVVEMTADTIDSVSGESYAGTGIVLKAASGGSVVTPMTTMLEVAQAADPTYSAADLATDMGLPVGVDIATYNPFAADADPAVAHEVEKVFQQVMTATLIVAEAMAGLGDIAGVQLTPEEASAAALKAVASMVLASEVEVDLSDATQVAELQTAAKTELAANGVEVSDAIADFVLGQASGTVTQVAAAYDRLTVEDFGTSAASAISLLKHDATAELAAMSEAAATFLADAANSDLAAFDATAFVTLNTEGGVNSAAAANEAEVNEYLGASTLDVLVDGVLLEGATLVVDAQDGGDNAAVIAMAPSVTDSTKNVIQISTNDSTKAAAWVALDADISSMTDGNLVFDIYMVTAPTAAGDQGFEVKLESGSGDDAVPGYATAIGSEADLGGDQWHTITQPISGLLAANQWAPNGAVDATGVTKIVWAAAWEAGQGAVFQIDNVRFVGTAPTDGGGGGVGASGPIAVLADGTLLDGATLVVDAQDGGDNAAVIAMAPSATDSTKNVIQISTNDSTKAAAWVALDADISSMTDGNLVFDIYMVTAPTAAGDQGFEVKLESGSGDDAVPGYATAIGSEADLGGDQWHTITQPISGLLAANQWAPNGAVDATGVTKIVWAAAWEAGQGAVFQIDNVRFVGGGSDSDSDPGSGDSGGGDDGDTTLEAGDYIDFNDPVEQQELTFTDFGTGTFTQFVQDPTDATRTVASTTKGATAEEWAGTTIDAGAVIFPLTETATTMTVRVYSPAPNMVVRLKLEESGDNTHTVETDAVTTVTDEWETLTFDFSNQAEGTAELDTSYVFDKLSIFFNKGVTGSVAGEVIFYWDSLTWVGAGPATAPEPTAAAGDVLSVFGTTYGNLAGANFDPAWGQTTDAVAGDEYVLNNLDYQGVAFDAGALDVSAYEYLHVDYYTDDSTAVNVFLISSEPSETAVALDVTTTGQWNSVDIPLASFTAVNLADVIQMKFDGNGTIRLDNIYFGGVAGGGPATAPEPTAAAGDVLSVFGTTYGNLAGANFDPAWGQTTDAVAGDEYVLNNLDYQGVAFDAGALDVSAYEYLHVDYYTDDSTAVNVFLISSEPSETAVALDVTTTGQWNSVDIPLASFTAVNLADVIQMKFDGNGTIRLDNIYFGGVAGGGPGGGGGAPTAPSSGADEPTLSGADVINMYGDFETAVAVHSWSTSWDSTNDPVEFDTGSGTVKKYEGINFTGIEMDAIDASGMTHFHVDVWTADADSLEIKIVDTTDAEYQNWTPGIMQIDGLLAQGEWVGIDIDLSLLGLPATDHIGQLVIAVMEEATVTKTIYLDNMYFYVGD